MKPRIAVVDAPSNLGLRPPAPGVVPGCYKLAGALRDRGLIARLGARDAGYVTPPRYDRHDWKPGEACSMPQRWRRTPGSSPIGSAPWSTWASSSWCSAATAASCSRRYSPCGAAAATAWPSWTATPTFAIRPTRPASAPLPVRTWRLSPAGAGRPRRPRGAATLRPRHRCRGDRHPRRR